MKRGALVVLEGLDRTGKSTQCELLDKYLRANNVPVKQLKFPARESNIGQVINSYLVNKQELSDECIHLLFSANRWEFKVDLRHMLESGTTLVIDRYSYSGVAYSTAKGLSYDWCMAPERGLIRPDAVFYLKTPVDVLSNRIDYGNERYEKIEFQRKVATVFDRMCEENCKFWHVIDANLTKDEISASIAEKTMQLLGIIESKPLSLLT